MKKITALLLCFLLLCACSVTAFAADTKTEITDTVISATVPDSHKITVSAEGAKVFHKGFSGVAFIVGRLSEPRFLIRAESGKVITSVTLDGEDVTDLLYGGYLDLAPVYKDQVIAVTTEDIPPASTDTFHITGKVTRNGQPLTGVTLELRSPLKTTKTDQNGQFIFEDVAPGELSMTALTDGKVIGYLAFELKADTKTELLLLEDGTYTVLVDQNSAGVELHLALDEEKGALVPANVKSVPKVEADAPQAEDTGFCWWWLLLLLVIICIVVLEIHRRKKKAN